MMMINRNLYKGNKGSPWTPPWTPPWLSVRRNIHKRWIHVEHRRCSARRSLRRCETTPPFILENGYAIAPFLVLRMPRLPRLRVLRGFAPPAIFCSPLFDVFCLSKIEFIIIEIINLAIFKKKIIINKKINYFHLI